MTVRLDHAGFAQVLRSPGMASMVHDAAESIASNVRALKPGVDVVVDDTTSYKDGRVVSDVTIREPYGRALQVRDGILTRAAAQIGAEVTAK